MKENKGGQMEEKKVEHVKHESVMHQPPSPSKMDKKVVVAVIVLAFLLVFSIVQTIQLVNMKSQLQSEDIGSAPLAGKKAASTQGGDLKSNIQNLPGMVGGC